MSDCNRKLLASEREARILRLIGSDGRGIAEMSAELGVSEATVRRDLQSLEKAGRVRRVHGGAVRVTFPRVEPVFSEKADMNTAEKERIADLAIEFINDGDTIYLDGGSTVLALARKLSVKRDLTVVTNSLMAAAELMDSGHRLILVGGEFRPKSRTTVGALTDKTLESVRFEKAFMGTIGLTIEDGMSTTDAGEARTKELAVRRAGEVFLLADSGKLEHPSTFVSGQLGDIDVLITDPGVSKRLVKQLEKRKIKIVS